MRKFEIWVEGFITMDGDSRAWKEGEQEAETFEEACDLYAESHPLFKQYYRKQDGQPIYWGCSLFDNEADARKSFG